MKKLVVLLMFLTVSVQAFANANPNETMETELRNQIAKLLDKPEIRLEDDVTYASIEFTLNSKNEIVILTVDSERSDIETYVKSRLNYKSLDKNLVKRENRIYKLKLKVLKPVS